jgi:tRNA pseudouridine38-40 synthase
MSVADPLTRVRLDVAYDGSAFSGWAVQPGRRTEQGALQGALATILRVPTVALGVAGRTDAGVHATGQVAHADLPGPIEADLVRRLAGVLPSDVLVRSIRPMPDAFDARFSALWRRYEYRVADRGVSPLRRGFVLDHRRALDVEAMNEAAAQLVGLRDFAAFCKRREGATTLRTMQHFSVEREPTTGELIARLQADAFCHSMVRSLIGALLAVGEGRRPPAWPAGLLSRTVRADEVMVAPPHGLTLVEVGYPPNDDPAALAARAERTRARR